MSRILYMPDKSRREPEGGKRKGRVQIAFNNELVHIWDSKLQS